MSGEVILVPLDFSRSSEVGARRIVIGTHGRRGLAKLLLGSVAEAVVRRASCPVLSVKVPERAR